MSEEKLYAVKNDEGQWADSGHNFGSGAWATTDEAEHEEYAKHYGGHVVTLIEEPKKVVLSEKQAKVIKYARSGNSPASNIAFSGNNDEELLINAYVHGYTLAKPKMYLVYEKLGGKTECDLIAQAMWEKPDTIFWEVSICMSDDNRHRFTQDDIERLGLQKYEKRESRGD